MKLTRQEILAHSLVITQEYSAQGLTMTLRQLYYQFVGRGLFPSSQLEYKRLGEVLTKARYAGTFPARLLADPTRSAPATDGVTFDVDVEVALDQMARYMRDMPEILINAARWYRQPVHVSVWVEKEALAGVFRGVTDELGVGMFACKGYPSVSALAGWLDGTHAACRGIRASSVVLYFGDHDPDGWEIPRSAERNLEKLMVVMGKPFPLTFKRIALNMDQIRRYAPPPFPAKVTSSRYQTYRDEHDTDDAWELDALEPTVLRDLIRAEVDALFDDDIHAGVRTEVREARAEMRRHPKWVRVREILG